MTENERELWSRIEKFQIDEAGIGFCFSDRLAIENNWKKEFAIRAIEEYRKFIYLCCVAGHQVTPSDEVDQVWHLHLTFTKSYWKDMCDGVLKKELHHNPTKGGSREKKKFDLCYNQTLDSYFKHFEKKPPADLWPDLNTRFQNAKHVRVDALRNWIIRKPQRSVRIATIVLLLAIGGLLNLQAYDSNTVMIGFSVMVVIAVIAIIIWRSGGGNDKGGSCSSGCTTSGCGGSHSGCSTSGCSSGCGGGGCGGGCGS